MAHRSQGDLCAIGILHGSHPVKRPACRSGGIIGCRLGEANTCRTSLPIEYNYIWYLSILVKYGICYNIFTKEYANSISI